MLEGCCTSPALHFVVLLMEVCWFSRLAGKETTLTAGKLLLVCTACTVRVPTSTAGESLEGEHDHNRAQVKADFKFFSA